MHLHHLLAFMISNLYRIGHSDKGGFTSTREVVTTSCASMLYSMGGVLQTCSVVDTVIIGAQKI